MWYFLEFAGLWNNTLSDIENSTLAPIVLKKEDLKNDAKLKYQAKYADEIYAWNKTNVKCKGYIDRMCLGHIQQKFQAIKIDWLAHDLWKWLKKRYTLQNTASKFATIISIDELTFATCKNIAKYQSKYYIFKASIKEQRITIEDAIKIQMLNNLGPVFKTYLTIVNNWM